MKGFTNEEPKIVAACIGVLTRGLRYNKLLLITTIPNVIKVSFVFSYYIDYSYGSILYA